MLDPTISLGIKPPEAVDFSKFAQLKNLGTQNDLMLQQIEASKASEANARAQNPGLVAQSITAEQAAIKAKQDQDANTHFINLVGTGNYTTKEGEVQKINYPKLFGDFSQKFPAQAMGMIKAKGESDDAAWKADTTQTGAEKAKREFVNSQIQTAANVIDKMNLPEDQKGPRLTTMIEGIAKLHPEAFIGSPYVVMDPTTKTVKATAILDGKAVKSVADGMMDPLTTAKLDIATKELALAQLKADPKYLSTVSTIQTPEQRGAALAGATEGEAYMKDLNSGLNAKVSVATFGKPGSVAADVWNKYVTQGGPYAEKQRALDAYNARNKTEYTVPGAGIEAVNRLLANESAKVSAATKTARQVATQPTIPQAAAAAPKAPEPVAAPAATKAPVPMKVISPQGKVRTIDASTWDAAKARGYKQVP